MPLHTSTVSSFYRGGILLAAPAARCKNSQRGLDDALGLTTMAGETLADARAGDGKAEPRPAEALSGRGIGLAELLEHLS